jgi:lactate dehydrogenase-like 2-hydroxyacid dehydrogenase
MGVHVTGKRLGILGMGRIGQALADRARAFRMTIHYSNRTRLAPELEKGAIFHANPDDMLPHCDILSINAPMTPRRANGSTPSASPACPRARSWSTPRAAAWSTTRR